MKKAIIAGSIIALSVLIYFICGRSDKPDESKTLMTTTGDSVQKSPSADDGEESSPSDSGDEEKGSRDEVRNTPENTVSFAVRGENRAYTFKVVNGFIKIARTSDMTGYVANFANDMLNIQVTNQATFSQVLSVMVPPDVTPGTYSEKSSNFMFQYFGNEPGVMYSIDVSNPFTLTIDEWGGSGGRAKGTFSGELKADGSNTIITIQDGRFDVSIQ